MVFIPLRGFAFLSTLLFAWHIGIDPQRERQWLPAVQLHQVSRIWVSPVRTVRPCGYSFPPGCVQYELPGPRICAFRRPPPSPTRAGPLAIWRRRFRLYVQPHTQNGMVRHRDENDVELCRDAPPVV